jgi:hypothetical protein
MKVLLSNAIVVFVAVLVMTTWVRAQSQSDRPPGVDEGSWVAISDTVGLVLVDVSFVAHSATPSDIPRGLSGFPQSTGILMVEVNGLWTRVEFAEAPARVRPLH